MISKLMDVFCSLVALGYGIYFFVLSFQTEGYESRVNMALALTLGAAGNYWADSAWRRSDD